MTWTGNAVPVSSSWARQNGFDTLSLFPPTDFWNYRVVGDDQRKDFSAATRFDVTKKAFNLTHVGNWIETNGMIAPITIFIYKGGDDPSKGNPAFKTDHYPGRE